MKPTDTVAFVLKKPYVTKILLRDLWKSDKPPTPCELLVQLYKLTQSRSVLENSPVELTWNGKDPAIIEVFPPL